MRVAHVVITVVLMFGSRGAFAHDDACGDTQAGINATAGVRLKTAEAEMGRVFDALMQQAKGKSEVIAKLRVAQAAWEAYRDAQINALWPLPDAATYGTAHPLCVALAKANLTEARTKELRAMQSPEEGDVCAVSWGE
jgi:uncharacterized protein YecT (DUF1311 family)